MIGCCQRQKKQWTETRNWPRWILFPTFCAMDSWQWLKMMNTQFGWTCLSGSRTRWSKDVSTSSKGWLRQLWSENKCHVSCIAFEVNQYFSHSFPRFCHFFFLVYHGIPISRHLSIKRLKPCLRALLKLSPGPWWCSAVCSFEVCGSSDCGSAVLKL